MWATVFSAVTQLFSALIVLFSGVEKFAKAFDHIGTIADESAGAMADESRMQREAKKRALLKELKLEPTPVAQLAASTPVETAA